jgi:hypothetical protein
MTPRIYNSTKIVSNNRLTRMVSLAALPVLLCSFALACASLCVGQTLNTNYEKVALLKWYPSIQTGNAFGAGPALGARPSTGPIFGWRFIKEPT